MTQLVWDGVQPVLVQTFIGFLVTVISFIYAWVGVKLKQKTNLQIEAFNRDALNLALTTAANLFLNSTMTQEQKIAAMKAYVEKSVPDAVTFFGDKLKDVFDQKAKSALKELGDNIELTSAVRLSAGQIASGAITAKEMIAGRIGATNPIAEYDANGNLVSAHR